MKQLNFLAAAISVFALSGCTDRSAKDTTKKSEPKGIIGEAVQLKAGHGLALHPKIKESIHLKTAEVSEQKMVPKFTVQLHVIQGGDGLRKVAFTPGTGTEASGWLTAATAAFLKPGYEVDLQAQTIGTITNEKGRVKRLEKSPYPALGEYELVVETEASFDTGTRLNAVFSAPEGEAVPTVPRSALLKTAEGLFVYTINEGFYLRTPVQVGAMNDEFAEIKDGLYAGDQIVVSPVDTLWMAELQILRGGKACTCGH